MDKRLTITINTPPKEVFEFVLDPKNTPKWVDGIKREETSDFPVRKGTIYRPYGEGDVVLGEYPVTEYNEGSTPSLTYTKDGTNYFARYSFAPTDNGGTLVEYYAWEDDGDLSGDPFTQATLEKLKHILENTNNHEIARRIIKKIQYANVATASKDGQPWNTPVFFLYDNDMHLYWFSDKSNQHSQNIRENSQAFITIYDSTVPIVPVHNCKGIYMAGSVKEINDLAEAEEALQGNNADIGIQAEDCVGQAVRRIYEFTPKQLWLNDAEVKDGVPLRDFRVELELTDVQGLVDNK